VKRFINHCVAWHAEDLAFTAINIMIIKLKTPRNCICEQPSIISYHYFTANVPWSTPVYLKVKSHLSKLPLRWSATLWGRDSTSTQWVRGSLSRELNRPRREAGHFLRPPTKKKQALSCTPTPIRVHHLLVNYTQTAFLYTQSENDLVVIFAT
jgi:hypothetical protein